MRKESPSVERSFFMPADGFPRNALERSTMFLGGERFAAKQLLSSLIYHRYSYRLSWHHAVIRLYEPPSVHGLNFIFFQLHTYTHRHTHSSHSGSAMNTPGLKYNLSVVYYTLRMITMWKPAPYVEISVGSIERTFHFSRRRISSMWFYRLSSELYFAKTGAQEESNRTGIRNYEWETGPATVLISSASCNFSSESGKASSVFIATARAVKKKKVIVYS